MHGVTITNTCDRQNQDITVKSSKLYPLDKAVSLKPGECITINYEKDEEFFIVVKDETKGETPPFTDTDGNRQFVFAEAEFLNIEQIQQKDKAEREEQQK